MLYTEILEQRTQQPVYQAPAAATYSKEMSLTAKQFIDLLPAVVRNESAEIEADDQQAVITDGERRATIRFEQRPDRELGSLTLPVLKVDFRLEGYTGNDIKRFSNTFDRCFLRMGGG